ncbi:hypothetical protein FA95DRAFT_1562950 [Auriscalpium vulgare]|uniref:Uncharacterized protein n=1 Tax=Auriscalpium vulgare TaxID=40419 RepID=A0ACB8RJC1_9AGAM|nr:hypothetical protein FA95DRAFT_1562950 [Auriscalpium vulgare]
MPLVPLSPQTVSVPSPSTHDAPAAAPRGDALPNETLLHIFSFLSRSYPVSNVSRRWREVAGALPHLWLVEIRLGSDRQRKRLAQAAHSLRPLSIEDYALTEADTDLVAECLPHTRALSIRMHHRTHLLSKLTRPAPMLEKLSLRVSMVATCPDGFLGNYAPNLQDLNLIAISGIPWTSPIFRGLVHLRVHFPEFGQTGAEHCEALLDALESMRSLEALSFDKAVNGGHQSDVHDARPKVLLPRLTRLAITGDHPERCLHLLTHIEAAPGTGLELSMTSYDRDAFRRAIPVVSRHVALWAQGAARQTSVYFRASDAVDACDMDVTIDRSPPRAASCHANTLDLNFTNFSASMLHAGISELTRLAWETVTWGTLEELILEDLPRNAAGLGLPDSWWNVLKTARCVRRLVARGKSVGVVLEFLTTQDVCLQHGRRDTLLPALKELVLEQSQEGSPWKRLPVELVDAFRVWLKDREEIGCRLDTLLTHEVLPSIDHIPAHL